VSENNEKSNLRSVITASSAGTLIEWYDFFIFGSLATVMADQFFPKGDPTVAFLSTLATFATGFVVRPFGAFFFGRLGDLVGRKHTFLVTLLLMGGSTFLIGVLPTFAQVGWLATLLLVVLRLLQGLALGGEYGGAATYVAEHAPNGKRGLYTSYIQTTATLGLFVSILVIIATKAGVGEAAFKEWGWRIPFLLSFVLVGVSYVIRIRMAESPLFAKKKAAGELSVNPIKESFVNPENRRLVLLSLFGATAGQGVVWYTGQFYAMVFMQKTLKLPDNVVYQIILISLAIATPFFIFFGALSDRVGRKPIMLTGMALAAVAFYPIYLAMTAAAGFNGTASVNPNVPLLIVLVTVQVLFVTMVYGPIAAFLVELFPTRIRYTSMSVPYHIGNGIFGGLVPFTTVWLNGLTKSIYAGLAYPIAIALITVVIGYFWLPDPHDRALEDA
jgi:MFS family permease